MSIPQAQVSITGVLALEDKLGTLDAVSVESTEFQYWASMLKLSGWLRTRSNCSWYSVSLPNVFGSVIGRVKCCGLTKVCS
jgi:hypothetical protein